MFDIFDSLFPLSEVEFNGDKYIRLRTVTYQDGIESLLAVKSDSKLPATVVLIQVNKVKETK